MSEYRSPMRTAHRKHVYLDSNDPRAKTEYDLEKYRSRIGSKLIVRESLQSSIDIEELPTDCLAIGSELADGYSEYHDNSSRFQINLIDSEENMIFCGNTLKNYDGSDETTFSPSSNITIVKFSKDGEFIWQKFIDIDGTDTNLDIKNAVLDNQDNIYLVGKAGLSIIDGNTYLNVFILKYSKNGTKLWAKKISSEYNGYTTYFEPSNITFNTGYTNLYIGVARTVQYGFSSEDRWFYVYEINTSSGDLTRSNKYYSTETFSPYRMVSLVPESMALCYANNNLYIFGRQRGTADKYLIVLKLSISSFKIIDSISISTTDANLKNYLTTASGLQGYISYSEVFFDKKTNKIYFAPKINFEPIFYELNLSGFYISNIHTIKLNLTIFPSAPRIKIKGIQKDSNDDILLLGTRYISNDDPAPFNSTFHFSFITRYALKSKKVKYFNYFRVTGSGNVTPSFEASSIYSRFSKILISTDVGLATVSSTYYPNQGTFSFKIPLNEGTYRRDLKINGPELHSSTRFQMLGYKNISTPSANFLQEDGTEYLEYSDDCLYTTFSYSENTNDELFTYQITEF